MRTEEGVGDIQQDASDITLDLRIEAHLGLSLQLLRLFGPLQRRMRTSSRALIFRAPSWAPNDDCWQACPWLQNHMHIVFKCHIIR